MAIIQCAKREGWTMMMLSVSVLVMWSAGTPAGREPWVYQGFETEAACAVHVMGSGSFAPQHWPGVKTATR
jgi:hypothetical protein